MHVQDPYDLNEQKREGGNVREKEYVVEKDEEKRQKDRESKRKKGRKINWWRERW